MNEDHDTFWFMSFRTTTGVTTLNGTFKKEPHATRIAAFEQIRTLVKEQQPHLANAIVVAFDVQPNQLDW
ncbi:MULTISPECIES: hypothetical protein [unclassified Streptomyces]|uniref:hypothetical protein n=1 Tax=unclassified Streptomyces TaxID=2593676 RepID=UPI0033316930